MEIGSKLKIARKGMGLTQEQTAEEASFTFVFPNMSYMAVGIALAACGLCAGQMWRRQKTTGGKNP